MAKAQLELELINLFKQNSLHTTVRETIDVLLAAGHKHTKQSVGDNLMILVKAGFLTYDQHKFSLSPNADKADLTAKIPKTCGRFGAKKIEIEPPLPRHYNDVERKLPPSDHCDKCKKELKHGDEFHIHQFANIQLCLCAECNMPQIRLPVERIDPQRLFSNIGKTHKDFNEWETPSISSFNTPP